MRIENARWPSPRIILAVFLLLIFATILLINHTQKVSNPEEVTSLEVDNLQNRSSRKYHVRSQKVVLESPASFNVLTRKSELPENPTRIRQITDHSKFLAELQNIDAATLPNSFIELGKFFGDRVTLAEDFVSPYYEEICSRVLSVVTSWVVNESGWPEEKVIEFIGNACENLQGRERDSRGILNIYIRALSLTVIESEGLKSHVLAARVNPNQEWMANLQGTVLAHEITKNYVPGERIDAINEIHDGQTRAYAVRAVLNDLSQEDIGMARLFYLSDDSISVKDQLLVDKLFPDPDDETLNMIMNSQNERHRDWALSSIAVKKFYLNDLDGANFIVDQIHDTELRNEAIRNIEAAKSRREQLKNIIPLGAPPGIFE